MLQLFEELDKVAKMGYGITGTAVSFESNIIKAAMNEDDVITARLFGKMLESEEGHHDSFAAIPEWL